jgi:hypothetical protein
MFTVGLIDQITAPIAKIRGQLNGLSANYQQGTMQMATGVGGIVASGYALQNALMPAIEMSRALGEVKSLGVQEGALKMLSQSSYEYALQYGESATEFVRSSYDIQSAIAGLNATDLSRFTMASNVLAKGTKSDAATITSYMGTMYGIFKNDAMQMGEGAWVERLTGMTATAVQAFKTDGKKMSDAWSQLGASAGLAPLQEQMAVLGTLQATMEGGTSATKYQAFLGGIGKAQKALGMSFVDSQGQMLPMVEILEKIQGKYGKLDSVQADIDKFDTAFGSKDARQLIQLLLKDVDGLKGSINTLGQVKGMEQATKMAEAMIDPSQQLSQSWYVIRAAIGSAILPAFNSFVGGIASMGKEVIWFTGMFPNITRWLGYIAVAFLSVVAVGALFSIMLGAGKMAMAGWRVVGALFAFDLVKIRAAMLALNISMYANPIAWLVAGIAAAVIAVGALIYYWDDLKATMGEWGWVKAIGGIFSSLWNGLQTMFNDTINWIIEKLNLIPFVDISTTAATGSVSSINAIEPVKATTPRGGISQQIANANTSKSTSVGAINIYPQKVDTNFANYVEMHS